MNLVKNVRLQQEHMNTPANNGRNSTSLVSLSKNHQGTRIVHKNYVYRKEHIFTNEKRTRF